MNMFSAEREFEGVFAGGVKPGVVARVDAISTDEFCEGGDRRRRGSVGGRPGDVTCGYVV